MRALPFLLLLAACAEFPALETRIPTAERTAPPPPLLPLDRLLAVTDTAPQIPDFEPTLRADAARLQAEAAGLPSGDVPEPDRIADLQARAEALRSEVLTEEERARLGSGASLP